MNDRSSNLTVRIKMVDLNHALRPSSPESKSSSEPVSILAGSSTDRVARPSSSAIQSSSSMGNYATGEICLHSGSHIQSSDFESHIEHCTICSNRVELQLDFIETLEVAIYQRRAEPESERVKGAMLISTPELNFAVCGEIEL